MAFKSLKDAIHIRNHMIEKFERADRETDADRRRALVTFVVAGAGFAGAELAGALNDFARGLLAFYPNVPLDDVRILLVHPQQRILPELSEPLAGYAMRRMMESVQLRAEKADAAWNAGLKLPRWDDAARIIADVIRKVRT